MRKRSAVMAALSIAVLFVLIQADYGQKHLSAIKQLPAGYCRFNEKPDLIITSMDISKSDEITVEIKNQGVCDAGKSTVTVYILPLGARDRTRNSPMHYWSKITSGSVPVIAAGKSYKYKATHSGIWKAVNVEKNGTTSWIGAMADSGGTVKESDENNNQKMFP